MCEAEVREVTAKFQTRRSLGCRDGWKAQPSRLKQLEPNWLSGQICGYVALVLGYRVHSKYIDQDNRHGFQLVCYIMYVTELTLLMSNST